LDRGHGFGTRALFAFIRMVSRQPVLDVVKLVRYRADFYGKPMSRVTQEAMRGPSTWSIGDRELMAAFIAKTNEWELWDRAHTAVAGRAYGSSKRIPATFSDAELSEVEEPLRSTLGMLGKLTRNGVLDPADVRAVLAAGASRQQIEDALAVCF